MAADDPPIDAADRSDERGSRIIEALETGRPYRGFFNVRNDGAISNLAADAIVEVPGYVDALGIHIPRVGDLPLACAATCSASIDVQRMGARAAASGDATLLKQAMLHDPLVGAVCNPPEIWRMADEMLVAQSQWLPQYEVEIPRAAERLREPSDVKTREWQGAARKRVRSLEEIRQAEDQPPMPVGRRR